MANTTPKPVWHNDYNPFSKAMLKNVQTGKWMDSLHADAARAEFDASAHDKSRNDRAFVATSMNVASDDANVRRYLGDVIRAIQGWSGDTVNMRNLLPVINEMKSFAQKDIMLSDKERAHINQRAAELSAYILEKTSLFTRTTEKLKGVVKTGARKQAADYLSGGGWVDRMVAGYFNKGVKKDEDAQAARETRATALGRVAHHSGEDDYDDDDYDAAYDKKKKTGTKKVVPTAQMKQFIDMLQSLAFNQAPGRGKAQAAAEPDEVEEAAPTTAKGKKRVTKAKATTAPTSKAKAVKTDAAGSTGLLTTSKQILSTDKAILKELHDQTGLIREELEAEFQAKETTERNSDENKKPTTPISDKVEKVPAAPNEGGLFSGGIGGLVGKLGESVTSLLPLLKTMGEGALVIGAAWAGWEVGSWISKMVGLGDSSDALRKLLDTHSQSIGSTLESIGRTFKDLLTRGQSSAQIETDAAVADSQKRAIDQALKHGMQTKDKFHEIDPNLPSEGFKMSNERLYKQALAFNQSGTPATVPTVHNLDTNAMPMMGDLASGLTGQHFERNVGKAVTKAGSKTITAVESSGNGWLVARMSDGSLEKRTGTVAWRANNPGNMRYNEFAVSLGAIGAVDGQIGKYAVFPDLATGERARQKLLFEGKNYKNLTVSEAVKRYAPNSENDTGRYQKIVLDAVGRDVPLNQLTTDERNRMLKAMETHEGFKAGSVTPVASPNGNRAAPPVKSLSDATSGAQAPIVVVAPQSGGSGGGMAVPMMPTPVTPRNPDDWLRGASAANNF